MAQHDYDIANQSFPAFRTDLNNVLGAINSSNSGTSRPSGAVAGTIWLDTSGGVTAHILKFYDGGADIPLATINTTANTVDFTDSSVTVSDNSITLEKLASGTDGNLISYDASGDPVAVATGSSGQVLTSAGAGAVPSFQTLTGNATHSGEVTGATALTIADNIVDEANLKVSNSPVNGYMLTAQSGASGGLTWAEASGGGGKINQVLMASKTNTQTSSSSNSWVDVSGLSVAITPSASNSKILVHFCCNISSSVNNHAAIKLLRGSTDIFVADADSNNVRLFAGWRTTDASQYHAQVQTGSFLDSPSSTSELTYKIQANGNDGFNINRPHASDNQASVQRTRGASSIIVMEVLA